jgi:hypothetical protein
MIDWETFKAQLQTNPSKVLKSVLLLAGCLLLIWIVVVLQNGSPAHQKTVKVYKSGRLEGLNSASGQTADSLTEDMPFLNTQHITPENSGSGLYVLLPVVLLFLIVIGGLWFWIRSKGTPASGKISGDVFTAIATQKIPGGQQLLVAKINGEYWVMATGGTQGVRLLHRYSSEEWKTIEKRPVKSGEEDTFWQTLKTTAAKKNNWNV